MFLSQTHCSCPVVVLDAADLQQEVLLLLWATLLVAPLQRGHAGWGGPRRHACTQPPRELMGHGAGVRHTLGGEGGEGGGGGGRGGEERGEGERENEICMCVGVWKGLL